MKRNEDMVWYDVCIQILMYKIRYCLRLFFFFIISIPPFIITKNHRRESCDIMFYNSMSTQVT